MESVLKYLKSNECENPVQSTFHEVICLFYTYWDFRIKFCCVKKHFGVDFEQSERQNDFFTCEKFVLPLWLVEVKSETLLRTANLIRKSQYEIKWILTWLCSYQEEAKGQLASCIHRTHCRLPGKTAQSQHTPGNYRNKITAEESHRWESQIWQPSTESLREMHLHPLVLCCFDCFH